MILIIPIAYSLTYEQSKEADLKVPCFNNGTFCSGSATCNATILYPNFSLIIDKQGMDNKGSYFNLTLNEDQTKTSGEYSAIISCSDGVYNGQSTFTFDVTPTGYVISSSQGLTSIGLIISIIFLAGLFLVFANKFSESDKLFPISLVFMFFSLLLGLYVLHLGYIYSRDILYPLVGEGVQFSIYIAFLWSLFLIMLCTFLLYLRKIIKEIQSKRMSMKQGDGYDPNKKEYK